MIASLLLLTGVICIKNEHTITSILFLCTFIYIDIPRDYRVARYSTTSEPENWRMRSGRVKRFDFNFTPVCTVGIFEPYISITISTMKITESTAQYEART